MRWLQFHVLWAASVIHTDDPPQATDTPLDEREGHQKTYRTSGKAHVVGEGTQLVGDFRGSHSAIVSDTKGEVEVTSFSQDVLEGSFRVDGRPPDAPRGPADPYDNVKLVPREEDVKLAPPRLAVAKA